MSDDTPDGLIARHLAGESSPGEAEELRLWMAAEPAHAEYVRRLEETWKLAGERRPPWSSAVAWEAVRGRIEERERDARLAPLRLEVARAPRFAPRFALSSRRPGFWIAAAAAAAIAVGSPVMLLRSDRAASSQAAAVPKPMREVVTRRGERAAFNLADGTRVMLGAESRLRIPAEYNTAAAGRLLLLEGEAYFQVRHDSTRAFRVQTPAGIAEDLGTEFVVTAYPESFRMQVVVATGAVALRRPPKSMDSVLAPTDTSALLTLTTGDLGRLDTAGVAILTRGIDIRPYLAWTEGALVFDGTRLREALLRIARWYDLEITLAEPTLADRRLTVTFRNQSAQHVLAQVALILDLRVEQSGRAVVLHPLRTDGDRPVRRPVN